MILAQVDISKREAETGQGSPEPRAVKLTAELRPHFQCDKQTFWNEAIGELVSWDKQKEQTPSLSSPRPLISPAVSFLSKARAFGNLPFHNNSVTTLEKQWNTNQIMVRLFYLSYVL